MEFARQSYASKLSDSSFWRLYHSQSRVWMPDLAWLAEREGVARRLGDALSSFVLEAGPVGPADVAGLTGHVLRRERAVHGGTPTLNLPAGASTATSWAAAGCQAVQVPEDRVIVSARPWHPVWLPGFVQAPIMDSVLREDPR